MKEKFFKFVDWVSKDRFRTAVALIAVLIFLSWLFGGDAKASELKDFGEPVQVLPGYIVLTQAGDVLACKNGSWGPDIHPNGVLLDCSKVSQSWMACSGDNTSGDLVCFKAAGRPGANDER